MTTTQLLIVCATLLALAGAHYYVRLREARGRTTAETAHGVLLREIGDSLENALALAEARAPGPLLVGKRVVVHTKRPDAQSVRGVVHGDYPDKLVLAEASYYREAGGEQVAQGTIEVDRKDISTTQVLRPTED